MSPLRLALALAGLATLAILVLPGASASTNQLACATTGYTQTGGAAAWWWATTDTTTDATTCVPESVSISHAGAGASEGGCTTVTIRGATTGAPTGGAPTAIHLYVYADRDGITHTNTFAGYLADLNIGTTLPATTSVCRTMDATSSGTSAPGNYRLVLRVCNYIGGSGCAGGTRAYDLWSDSGGNLPAGGTAYSNERSGVLVARAFMYCARDSANGALGPNTDTYVPGDVPTLAVCTHSFNTNTYSLSSTAWNGVTGGNGAIVVGQGISGSGNPLVATFAKITAAEPDGTCQCQWTNGATYIVNFTWTNGGSLSCYGCVPEGIVGWANTTSGTLNAGNAVHDAPLGTINKTLTATCVPRDPLTGSSTLAPAKLARAEQVQCRGIGAGGQAQIRNSRGEDWATGAFLSVYARRESQSTQDTTDAPRCDVTTTTAGVYQCDVTLRASTYANNAVVGGATATSGLGYGVDVAIYQESARTTLLARAHIANLFDATPTLSYASATGTCSVAPSASLAIAQRGQTEVLSFKLCNPRAQLVTPTGTADVTRQDTYIVDQGPQALAPASGSYSWSFTTNGASQHTPAGYAKRLNFTDGNGNNATASSAFNLSDYLTVGAFHTWLKSCTGPESSLFVAAADTICANEGPVTSAIGAPWTSAKTFVRWYNNTPDNAQLASDSESGVTSTTSSNHQVTPQPPAGTWTFTVRAYDANGNYGEASKTVTIVSPLTSIYDILCSGTNVRIEPGENLTAICTTMKRSPSTYVMEPYCPDDTPYYRVNYTTSDGAWHAAVPTTTPLADTASPCSYWINWTVPASWPERRPAELLVNANMSGAPIHAYYPLNIESTKGADPALATAEYSWDTHVATMSLSLKYGNGTARSGIATLIEGELYAPDDSTATATLTFAERAGTGTYYARVDLGTSPTRGTWLAVVTVPQPTGNSFTSSAATFTIAENFTLKFLDQRELALALWSNLNASLAQVERHLNDSTNATLNSLAYTRELLNLTSTITPATTISVTLTGDAGSPDVYAGRAAKLEGVANATGPGAFGAWFWTWDYGDNTTGLGTPAYHAWTQPGNYTIRASATSALGNTTTLTLNKSVRLSTPHVEIVGPQSVTAGTRATWSIGSTHDAHDDLVATDWEVDPHDVDSWLVGHQHLNKGWCSDCATYTTTFFAVGDHTIQLTARNAHDVTNTTTLTVHVLPFPRPAPGNAPLGVGQDDLAKANENARDFMETLRDFIQWISG